MADNIGQNIKGTVQKIKGDIEMKSPHVDDKVKGAVDKLKGEWNQSSSTDEGHDDDPR